MSRIFRQIERQIRVVVFTEFLMLFSLKQISAVNREGFEPKTCCLNVNLSSAIEYSQNDGRFFRIHYEELRISVRNKNQSRLFVVCTAVAG